MGLHLCAGKNRDTNFQLYEGESAGDAGTWLRNGCGVLDIVQAELYMLDIEGGTTGNYGRLVRFLGGAVEVSRTAVLFLGLGCLRTCKATKKEEKHCPQGQTERSSTSRKELE